MTSEIETCKWLTLTSDMPWEPSKIPFQEFEDAAVAASDIVNTKDRMIYSISRSSLTIMSEISSIFDDRHVDATLNISAIKTSAQQPRVTASKLAKRWAISESMAAKTLRVMTQKGLCNALFPVERRFRTKQAQLRYPQLSGCHGRFYTGTFFASVPAVDMSVCSQLFSNDFGFNMAYPMQLKSETPNALRCFIQDVGVPQTLHSDNAKELMSGDLKRISNDFMIRTTYTEPHSPWQDRAERQYKGA
jgi:hypothetical protein